MSTTIHMPLNAQCSIRDTQLNRGRWVAYVRHSRSNWSSARIMAKLVVATAIVSSTPWYRVGVNAFLRSLEEPQGKGR
eukprot:scaffold513300_cov181-Attheya_sp.AAC.1